MTYDEDSNIIRMTYALGETTEFGYDVVDRLLSSVDAKGQLRAFAYEERIFPNSAISSAETLRRFTGYVFKAVMTAHLAL